MYLCKLDWNYCYTVKNVGFEQENCRVIFGFHTGEDGLGKEEENEDEYLNLLYDPCLNCYFDPKTGKYYELAWFKAH